MNQQLIINVTNPAILPSLRKVLEAMDGVSIERSSRRKPKATKKEADESWLANPEVSASIQRGENDLASGRSQQMTSSEIRELLGV